MLSSDARHYLAIKQSRADRLAHRRARLPFFADVAPIIYRNPPLEDFLPRRGRVLVVGCGGGHGLGHAVGIDIDRPALRVARELGARALSLARAERMPFRDGAFDAILCDNVVEHLELDALRAHFHEARRVLKPGGAYVMATPHPLYRSAHRPGHTTLLPHRPWARLLADAGFGRIRTPLFATRRLASLDHKVWLERAYGLVPWRWGAAKLGLKTVKLVASA